MQNTLARKFLLYDQCTGDRFGNGYPQPIDGATGYSDTGQTAVVPAVTAL